MKLVEIRRCNVPLPAEPESKADAIPHNKILVLRTICDQCKYVSAHPIPRQSAYTLEQVEAIAIAAFNLAHFECGCHDSTTAKPV